MPNDRITTDFADGWRAGIEAFRAAQQADLARRQAFADANTRFGMIGSVASLTARDIAEMPAPEPARRAWAHTWQHSPPGEATGTEGRGA